MLDVTHCRTVGELISALNDDAGARMTDDPDPPIATLYDWGAGVKYGVTVRGPHTCTVECDPYDCSLAGHVVLDIDPRPERLDT